MVGQKIVALLTRVRFPLVTHTNKTTSKNWGRFVCVDWARESNRSEARYEPSRKTRWTIERPRSCLWQVRAYPGQANRSQFRRPVRAEFPLVTQLWYNENMRKFYLKIIFFCLPIFLSAKIVLAQPIEANNPYGQVYCHGVRQFQFDPCPEPNLVYPLVIFNDINIRFFIILTIAFFVFLISFFYFYKVYRRKIKNIK